MSARIVCGTCGKSPDEHEWYPVTCTECRAAVSACVDAPTVCWKCARRRSRNPTG